MKNHTVPTKGLLQQQNRLQLESYNVTNWEYDGTAR